MPNPKSKARTRKSIRLLMVVVVVAVIIAGTLLIFHHGAAKPTAAKLVIGSGTTASIFKLETVSDQASQEKGLGGRAGLASNTGMLFKYTDVTNRCMWMKDMRFNLDIIWLDANHRITSIVANLTPGTYPQSYCAKAQYVVELNAGTARANGLRVGQIVSL